MKQMKQMKQIILINKNYFIDIKHFPSNKFFFLLSALLSALLSVLSVLSILSVFILPLFIIFQLDIFVELI